MVENESCCLLYSYEVYVPSRDQKKRVVTSSHFLGGHSVLMQLWLVKPAFIPHLPFVYKSVVLKFSNGDLGVVVFLSVIG